LPWRNEKSEPDRISTGCCPNENLFERSLKRFLFINLGEVKEKRFQLFESEGRVLESPVTSLKIYQKMFQSQQKMIWETARQSVIRSHLKIKILVQDQGGASF